ncbi:glycosyltransferase family 2 protein [bacterium]|jgi:glycosyltransferase involved in cell wall biosynthesis|nr:glycosyltransferase family 2 protein [bacterium]MBT4251169.1 glycosyltransferase family 2 protein [bacterium]MBT4598039.1 glycosyltransferase family 2 protein [bacterium]MBT6753549.1 glycosyltransferase family 2 protein [bacterium]MBT7037664.1 glycosyltransferase family 2 protein [bacterium]
MKSKEKLLSIVVPIYNEGENVEKLHQEVLSAIKKNKLNAEIIFVDDGSSDNTVKLAEKLTPLRLIVFRRNFGQTAAMDAGIKAVKGEIVVTMDGDLQNDPNDILLLLEKMDEGFDIVSGWRKNRRDPFMKKLLSRGADKLRKTLINDQINDSGCSLKAYKTECFENVDLYGEMHRFIPAILKIKGFKVGEVVVSHRPRIAGETKYTYTRLAKGLLDLIGVWFWRKYANRPLHLFGGIGSIMGFVGTLILIWMAIERGIFGNPIGDRIWPVIGVLFVVLGIQFFVSGVIADIAVKTYYTAKKETVYLVKDVIENK